MPKKINWAIIKKRYLTGEKPVDIATDYGITSKQVRDKAHREEWSAIKATLCDEIATEVRQQAKVEITDTVTLAGLLFHGLIGKSIEALPQISANPTPIKMHTNKYVDEAVKQGIKYYLEFQKLTAKNQPNGEKPGINIIAPKPDD